MTALRLDYQPWGETLAELVDAARRAQGAGAGVVWAPELHRDALITSAAMAAGTTSVGIGAGIALAFARSPMLTALAALDLDELSGGRFRLGLGPGVARLNADWHDAAFEQPVARLRDTVAIVRAVMADGHTGRDIVHSGVRSIRVQGWRRPYPPTRPQVPIYLAAVGPAMTALAGEAADGWLSHELCPPAQLSAVNLPGLGRGMTRAGRERADFDVVVSACCSVDADPATARRRAAGVVGFYASVASYAELFSGFADAHAAAVATRRAGTAPDRLADVIPDEMVAAFTLAGTTEDVRRGLAAYEGLADAVKLAPPTHGLGPDEIRAAQNAIIDLIGDLT